MVSYLGKTSWIHESQTSVILAMVGVLSSHFHIYLTFLGMQGILADGIWSCLISPLSWMSFRIIFWVRTKTHP